MSKTALFVLVAALVVVTSSVVIATRPDRYRVARSDNSAVSAHALFALASNQAALAQWSPWGPGIVKMTILDVHPPARVTMRLEFAEPIHSVATGTIDIRPAPNRQTAVTWTVEGTFGFAGKAWSLVSGMDAALGPRLDRGLANLSRLPELTRRWGDSPRPLGRAGAAGG
jgi:hypothetical protein